MVGFSGDQKTLLDRMVRMGEIDGMKPKEILSMPEYEASFASIRRQTFNFALRRLREKYGKTDARRKRKYFLLLSLVHV